jgi:membrane fusion protein (multidrug efflux system)
VPQRAVQELQGAFQLRLVGPDNKLSTRPVKLGDRFGSRAIVEEGLKPGERVVVEGPQARDGTLVNPKPYAPPAETSQTPPAATGGK